MRKIITSATLLLGFTLSAQLPCYTTETQNKWFAEHPELKAGFDKHQQQSAEIDRELFKNGYQTANKGAAPGTHTIPVVFHILHLGGSENISDAQVIDAVNILTRDFNADNADTSDVVVEFKNLIGNAGFDFVLATKDPNGNCTNGIIRHYDVNTDWENTTANYAYTWPPSRYMNVYVVRTMGGGAAGYTYLPGSGIPTVKDAIVILNGYVGSIGTGNNGTSRALTHEVGHWLNLPHVWGGTNQPGVACGDEGVSDTPITEGYTSCTINNTNKCNPAIKENIQNYMDYAYCQRMYTIGQATRMQTAINSPVNGRNNLSSASNLAFTGVTQPGANCIPMLDIAAAPSLIVCVGKPLTLTSFTSNAAPTTYLWTTDNSAVITNPGAASTSIQFNTIGTTNVTCVASNANGSVSKTISVKVEDSAPQIQTSDFESFEADNIAPPVLWKVINPTSPNEKWEVTSGGGADGINAVFIPGESLVANSVEILESPSYNFKNNPGAIFSFQYAYAKHNSTNKDIFKVQASRNCGASWTDIWVPTNSSLATNSGGVSSDLFFPTIDQWKSKKLNDQPQFYPFTQEQSVMIRFYFKEDVDGSGFGNRFYLDAVQFTTPVGINELTKAIDLNVYPNPSNSVFNVSFTLADASKIKYQVTSVSGAVLIKENEKTYIQGSHEIKINDKSTLTKGIYFLNFELNGVKLNKKLIIN